MRSCVCANARVKFLGGGCEGGMGSLAKGNWLIPWTKKNLLACCFLQNPSQTCLPWIHIYFDLSYCLSLIFTYHSFDSVLFLFLFIFLSDGGVGVRSLPQWPEGNQISRYILYWMFPASMHVAYCYLIRNMRKTRNFAKRLGRHQLEGVHLIRSGIYGITPRCYNIILAYKG